MIARIYIRIALLLPLFASMLACSYKTLQVQYSLAVYPMNKDEEVLMRGAIKEFSNSKGFSKFTEASIADYLRADGRYLYSFTGPDESYISVSNVLNTKCYDIGIHSSVSEATAQALGEQLRKILGSTVSTEVIAESECNASNKSPT